MSIMKRFLCKSSQIKLCWPVHLAHGDCACKFISAICTKKGCDFERMLRKKTSTSNLVRREVKLPIKL